jgi:hypothetical protein
MTIEEANSSSSLMREIFLKFELNLKLMSTFIMLPSFEYMAIIKILHHSDTHFGAVSKIFERTELDAADTLMLLVIINFIR